MSKIMTYYRLMLAVILISRVSALRCQSLRDDSFQKLESAPIWSAYQSKEISPTPSIKTTTTPSSKTPRTAISFCPIKCNCNFTDLHQLRVACGKIFTNDNEFPSQNLRSDIEILIIEPNDPQAENQITLGPFFQRLRLLKVLEIKRSRVPSIGRRTFWGLSGLRVLNLNENKLTNVVDQNFEGLYSLRELYLEDNEIRSLVSAAFHHISRLETLSLKSNQISDLAPRIFYKLRQLKKLILSDNPIRHINQKIFEDIPNIEVLQISNCHLSTLPLPKSFKLIRLKDLDLSFNQFKDLNSSIHPAFLDKLHKLNARGNQLTKLNPLSSPQLMYLDVAENNITQLMDCALCNTTIRDLDISWNRRLNFLNGRVVKESSHQYLTRLSLKGNWVPPEGIRDFIGKFPNLETLDVSSTGIISLPLNFLKGNKQLKSANFSGNFLISFETELLESVSNKLMTLDISKNYFNGLPESFFDFVQKRMSRIRMIYLQNNQWTCDSCHIIPIYKWLKKSLMYWGACFGTDNQLCLRCYKPNDFLHLPIEDLEEYEIPECIEQENEMLEALNENGNKVSSHATTAFNVKVSLTSQAFVIGVSLFLLISFIIIVVLSHYRHYGVYLTGEEDQLVDRDIVLKNPVVVLDKNSESYINLRYPMSGSNGNSSTT